MVEAGTGTGKSYAYLAAALLNRRDRRNPILVSTATINLQNQLMQSDIPRIGSIVAHFARQRQLPPPLGEPPTAVVLLGRSNFVSVRRARYALEQEATSPAETEQLERVSRWLATTQEGLLSELELSETVLDAIESQSDNCLGQRCPTHSQCFYFRRRHAVMQADIVVVNHALLCTDMRLRESRNDARGVLPECGTVIIDEAHNLAATAIEHFGQAFSSHAVAVALQKLHRPKGKKSGGALARFEHADLLMQMALNDDQIRQVRELQPNILSTVAHAAEELLRWNLEAAKLVSSRERVRLTPEQPLLAGLCEISDALSEALGTLCRDLESYTELVDSLHALPEHPLRDAHLELLSAHRRLQAHTDALQHLLWNPIVRAVRFVERHSRSIVLAEHPLEPGSRLAQSLWNASEAVWLTSATLQTSQKFDALQSRLGLTTDAGCEADVAGLVVPSPFSWATQAALIVDPQAPSPNDQAAFEHYLIVTVARLAETTRGRMFVLMTNAQQLHRLSDGLRLALNHVGLRALVQGQGSREQLLRSFLEGQAVLFGLQSFWEGVDVPGPALSAVVIPRLPFPSPGDPWTAAYLEYLEALGHNTFSEFMMPSASLKLRQGFGRLIRHHNDRGICVILDNRLIQQNYGKVLLRDLPTLPLHHLGTAEADAAIARLVERQS